MIPTASLPFSSPAPRLGRLLIVDDEVELMTALREMLTRQGYEVVGYTSGQEALEALRAGEFDLLLTDLMMPGLDGIALLRAGLETDPHLVGVIMTGQGTVQTAVEAMKTGAFDYVLKPFKLSAVLPILSRALDVRRLRVENVQLRETVAIYELSQTIAFTLDLNTILNKTADAALQQCEADEASVMLPTPEGQELYVAAVRGEQRAHLLGARVPFEQSIAGWVARRREPVNLQGEVRDARFAPIHPRPDIQSALSIPMLAGNQLVGVLNVNATRRRRRFTLGQVKALSILVSTAAAALENAWLHAQVQEAEERFRRLAENARDLIYRYRYLPTRGFEYVSPAATAITGYTPEEHYADPELGLKLVHPDDRPAVAAASRGEEFPGALLTLRWVRKDGSLVWTELQNVPIYDEAGRLVAVEGIARDITERKQAQDALRESEDGYRDLIEHIHDLICTHDPEGQILSANQSASKMLGYAPHELVGKNLRDILAPEVRHEFDNYLSTIRQKGAAHGLMRVETRSGERRIWEYDNSLRTEGVSAPIVRGFARDITERKRAEKALQELKFIVNKSPAVAILWRATEGWPVDFVSENISQFGYTPEDFTSGKILYASIVHPDDLARMTLEIEQHIQAGRTEYTQEYRILTRSGETRWLDDRTWVRRDKDGLVTYYQGIIVDITERKRAEEAVRESEARLRTILENMPVMLNALDEAYNIVAWNRECERVTGYSAEEIFSHPNVAELLYPDPAYRERMQAALAASGDDYRDWEWATTCKDGSVKTIAWSNISSRFPIPGWARWGVGVDLTERKRAEAAVAASEAELRALFAAMTDVILVLDAQGRYLKIAPTNPALLYKPPADLIGKTIHDVFPAAQADTFLHSIRQALAAGRPIKVEYSLTIDSAQIWFDATVSPMSEKTVFWVARDITERKQRERELEATAAVSAALRAAANRSQMLPVVLDHVLALLDAAGAALALRDPATREIVIELGRGTWEARTGLRRAPGQGLTSAVIETGEVYISPDVSSDPRVTQPELVGQSRAGVCLPLVARKNTIGALWVAREREFEPGEVRILVALADLVANALQRETLHEETQRNLERLAALRTIDSAISASLDLRITLDVLLDQVVSQLHVDAADVLLLSPHTHSLDYAAGRGFRSGDAGRAHVQLGQGYAGRAALERRLVGLPDLADEEPDFSRAALVAGEGLRAYYGVPLIAKGQVEGVLEIFHRTPLRPDRDWLDFLEALAGQAAIAIDSAELFTQLQHSNLKLTLAYDATIEGWSRALDLRDKETEGHTRRVTEMTLKLARAMGLGEEELVHVRRGALLHDIGKMGVPDGILLKPGPLTEDEWVVMRKHPTYAYDMLSPIVYLRPALDIPYCHHEKWDGTGYPRGLMGDRIPLAARIFAVADVWDALRSDRPYRPGWPTEKVREHIRSLAGTHFDLAAVEVFLRLADESGA